MSPTHASSHHVAVPRKDVDTLAQDRARGRMGAIAVTVLAVALLLVALRRLARRLDEERAERLLAAEFEALEGETARGARPEDPCSPS